MLRGILVFLLFDILLDGSKATIGVGEFSDELFLKKEMKLCGFYYVV